MKIAKNKLLVLIALLLAAIYILFEQVNHEQPGNLTVYKKIADGNSFNYLIIGDSIGRGSGAEKQSLRWFNQLEVLIKERYGSSARRHSIVQSGATAFEGIYKLQNSALSRKMDLIFIVFGENDRKFMDQYEFSFLYENLVIKTKELYPGAEIITFVESSLKHEPFADVIKTISFKYGARTLDMRIPFSDSGLLTEHLTSDMIHPNGKGYQLYARSIFEFINKNIENEPVIASATKPLLKNDYFSLTDKKDPSRNNGFIFEEGVFVSSRKGNYLEYEFQGSILGVNALRHENGGMMDVFIDGEYVRTISTWWPFARERQIYIASGLDNGRHTVRFEAIEDVSANNISKKSVIQIFSIIVASEREK
ncbi:MAG TPA: SGNH/GDSL hydrolase family protein [Bacillus bacterium]|nr:SGNH/GDSL hydrolase family protein [Bacillus sp. (in: firmicutes)]